jgi:hypothetical protein
MFVDYPQLQLIFQNLVFILCQMRAKLCPHNLDNSELRYYYCRLQKNQ